MTTLPATVSLPKPISHPLYLRGLVPGAPLAAQPSIEQLDVYQLLHNSKDYAGGVRHVIRDKRTEQVYFGAHRDFYPLVSQLRGKLVSRHKADVPFEYFKALGMYMPVSIEYTQRLEPRRIIFPMQSSAELIPLDHLPEGALFYAIPELETEAQALFVDENEDVHLLHVLFFDDPERVPQVTLQTGALHQRLTPFEELPGQLDYILNRMARLVVNPVERFFDLWTRDPRAFLSFLETDDAVT